MTKEAVAGVVRALLSAVGGYFVGTGVVDADTVAQISGAASILAAAIWSIWSKQPAAV